MAHDRPRRVADEFAHEVSAMLARGLKDPRITGFVTVTGAKMSPDLREVTVFVSVHGEEKVRRDTFAGLEAAAGFVQREVSRALRLRHTPHLRFSYDASVERGDRMERLIKEARAKDAAGAAPAGPGAEKDAE
jgi:ribosome-binding factor A